MRFSSSIADFDAFSAFDYMLSIGVRPLVELSFTPDPLNKDWVPGLPVPPVCNHFHCKSHACGSRRCVSHETAPDTMSLATDDGCETFPTNLTAYTEYIKDFTAAAIARYGEDEVASQWLFEVYNEADLHWPFEMYAQLYQAAAKGVKAASSKIRVGGPASAWPTWTGQLIEYCQNNSVPLDFVTTHACELHSCVQC